MSQMMQDRYGVESPRRRVLLISATTVLAAVFLAWVAWTAWFHADPAIEATVSRYEITSTHLVRAQVAVRFRNDSVQGTCLLRATASDHSIVGELNLSVADLRADAGRWIDVRTERQATTIELIRCTQGS